MEAEPRWVAAAVRAAAGAAAEEHAVAKAAAGAAAEEHAVAKAAAEEHAVKRATRALGLTRLAEDMGRRARPTTP